MNLKRSPVVNDGVLLRRDCDDAYLRVLAEQLVTNAWPLAGLVKRDDHEIGQGPLYALEDLRLLGDFPDNFKVGLIRERREDEFPHEPRVICDEDPDRFFHGTLQVPRVSVPQCALVRLKNWLLSGINSDRKEILRWFQLVPKMN